MISLPLLVIFFVFITAAIVRRNVFMTILMIYMASIIALLQFILSIKYKNQIVETDLVFHMVILITVYCVVGFMTVYSFYKRTNEVMTQEVKNRTIIND